MPLHMNVLRLLARLGHICHGAHPPAKATIFMTSVSVCAQQGQ